MGLCLCMHMHIYVVNCPYVFLNVSISILYKHKVMYVFKRKHNSVRVFMYVHRPDAFLRCIDGFCKMTYANKNYDSNIYMYLCIYLCMGVGGA